MHPAVNERISFGLTVELGIRPEAALAFIQALGQPRVLPVTLVFSIKKRLSMQPDYIALTNGRFTSFCTDR